MGTDRAEDRSQPYELVRQSSVADELGLQVRPTRVSPSVLPDALVVLQQQIDLPDFGQIIRVIRPTHNQLLVNKGLQADALM